MSRPPGRVPRPRLTQSRIYQVVVPAALIIAGALTITIILLAAAVLLGVLPYPGR